MVDPIISKPWYQKWWGIVLIIIFLPFVILYLVWKKTNWNKWVKITITVAFVIIAIISSAAEPNQEDKKPLNSVDQNALNTEKQESNIKAPDQQPEVKKEETPEEKEAREKKEQEEARVKKEEEEARVKKEQEEARTATIEKQFSVWNGEHVKLTRIIKDSMNNPDSYKHVKTGYFDMGDHIIINTTFRGENAFGGTITSTAKGKASFDGESVELLELDGETL